METVYLDELFFLNLIIDYFLLMATARICALPFRRGRFAAAAALGALWSCLSLVPGLFFLGLPVMHPVLALGMALIAFGGEGRLWRCLFAFLGVSALFGGAVYAAGLYRGAARSRAPIVRVDLRVLALSFALCWALVSLVFRRSVKRAERVICDISMEKNGRTVRFRALADTGNGLYDPISGCAALVAEPDALAPLFPGAAVWLRAPPVDAAAHIPGARLIPCASVSGGGLLLAFRPDSVTVDGTPRRDLIAAVAASDLGGDGSFQAVVPPP